MRKICCIFLISIICSLAGCTDNSSSTNLDTTVSIETTVTEKTECKLFENRYYEFKSEMGEPDTYVDELFLKYDNDKIYGYNCSSSYIFDDNGKLWCVGYDILSNDNGYHDVFTPIKEKMIEEYGENYTDKSSEVSDTPILYFWEEYYSNAIVTLSVDTDNKVSIIVYEPSEEENDDLGAKLS